LLLLLLLSLFIIGIKKPQLINNEKDLFDIIYYNTNFIL